MGRATHGSGVGRVLGLALAGALLVPAPGAVLAGAEEQEYAGGAACLECHQAAAKRLIGSHHAGHDCEGCHGPLAAHAADPAAQRPGPTPPNVCLMCHQKGTGLPKTFPQVDPARHHPESKRCTGCHVAHHPEQKKQKKGRRR